MKKILLLLLVVTSYFTHAQNVGVGTTTPGTKFTISTNGYGLEHTNGTVSIKSYISGTLAQIGTYSNHPLQLMANNGSAQFILMPTGLVGIGIANSTPTLAGLTVDKEVGNVNAIFGSNSTGIAIENSSPGIGFNSYYSNGRKFISPGFGGVIGYNPNNGTFTIASTTVAGTAANAAASTPSVLTITSGGFVGIGTVAPAANLDVNGNIFVSGLLKLTSGTPANGSYLAGNVNGYASWAPASNLAHITTATNSYGFTHTDGTATIATYVGTPGSNSLVTSLGLGGWVGTQTNHPLYFFANGLPAMSIATSGHIAMGSATNNTRLDIDGAMSVVNQYIANAFNNVIAFGAQATGSATYNTGVSAQAISSGTTSSTGLSAFASGGGNVYGVYSGVSTGWAGYFDGNVFTTGTYQTSDEKLKTNIAAYNDVAITTLKKLTVKTYTFRRDGDYAKMNMTTEPQVGIMAADVQKQFPQLVKKAVTQILDDKTHQPNGKTIEFDAVNYTGLVPILVKGLQEQQQQIDALKAEVEALKALIKK